MIWLFYTDQNISNKILSHDLSAKRITGVDKLFVDMTDDEISDLRTEDNEKILSLQDVFNRYGNTVNYVIELKENSNQTKLFEDLVKKITWKIIS